MSTPVLVVVLAFAAIGLVTVLFVASMVLLVIFDEWKKPQGWIPWGK